MSLIFVNLIIKSAIFIITFYIVLYPKAYAAGSRVRSTHRSQAAIKASTSGVMAQFCIPRT